MQFARDSRDLLMLAPCRSCSPRLFVADARSDLCTKKSKKGPPATQKRDDELKFVKIPTKTGRYYVRFSMDRPPRHAPAREGVVASPHAEK